LGGDHIRQEPQQEEGSFEQCLHGRVV
jgi:hypothetical protein